MYKYLLTLLTILCLFGFEVQGQSTIDTTAVVDDTTSTSISPDSIFYQMIGLSTISDIEKSVNIEGYKLGKRSNDTSVQRFHGYRIKQKILLEPIIASAVKEKLINERNYWVTNTQKRCSFKPELGLVLTSDNKKTTVLISLNCDVIWISDEDEGKTHNIDPSHNEWENVIAILFVPTEEDEPRP